jgi:hypothetical protein
MPIVDAERRKAYHRAYNKMRQPKDSDTASKAVVRPWNAKVGAKILGWCAKCADLPWRRPKGVKCACGQYYAAEVVACEIPTMGSSLGRCVDYGSNE